jgi:hypothetical protein
MNVLDKSKLLEFMGKRKDSLYEQVIRDFCGGLEGRLYAHNELKYWKEAIERGEFDSELKEVYVILSATHPEIADFTFYDDINEVRKRVDWLNKVARKTEYWYVTLYRRSDMNAE